MNHNSFKQSKLIQTLTHDELTVKVYYSSEWQEFQVKQYINGKLQDEWTYFTTDKQDALTHARIME